MTGPGPLQTRRYRIEWMLLGTALLVLGALTGYWLYEERNQVESRERNRLQTQARVIDENLGRQLEGANNALAGVRNDFPVSDRKNMGQAVSRRLKALSDAIPGVRTMLVFDAEGTVLAANRDELLGMNFSQREYFTVPRERPDPATLYISPPFTTALGVYSINVVRMVTGSRGEFAGIVSATLDPEYFNVLLRSVLYAPDMRVAIAHGDGVVFLYVPPGNRTAGIDLAKPGSFFTRHRESGQTATIMTGTVYATEEERMVAMRTIRPANVPTDKPLVVAVGRELSAIYAPWRNDALRYGGLYAVIALTTSLGLTFTQRRRRKLERLEADRERDRRESAERQELALRASEAKFRTLAEEGLVGVSIIQDGRFKYVNPARARMLGYSPEDLLGASSVLEFVADEDRTLVRENLRRRQDGEVSSMRYTFRGRKKDGSLAYFEVFGSRIAMDGRAAVISTLLDITERKRTEQALHDNAKRLRGLSRRLIAVEETERRNINRELHDRVGQNLAALNINLNIIRSQLSQESRDAVGARLRDTQTLLEGMAAQVRDVMADLHPPALDDYGLLAALRTYVESLGARCAVPITVHGEDLAPRLPLATETALFRIAQEALANAVKHARARHIQLLLAATPDRVALTIADDGVGFDAGHAALAHASWGLAIMRERAEAVGAALRIDTAPGRGTRVVVEIEREAA